MGKFVEEYINNFDKVQLPEAKKVPWEPETPEEIPFYKALDQAIIAFVKSRNKNMMIPDMKEFLYDFCNLYPVRETAIRVRVEKLKERSWRY